MLDSSTQRNVVGILLRISGDIQLLPLSAFMAWTGTILHVRNRIILIFI
jgi:hypothetical protein